MSLSRQCSAVSRSRSDGSYFVNPPQQTNDIAAADHRWQRPVTIKALTLFPQCGERSLQACQRCALVVVSAWGHPV